MDIRVIALATVFFTGTAGSGASPQITFKAANIRDGVYTYTEDLQKLDGCIAHPSAAQWPVFTSPFRLDNWGPAFQSHPDRQFLAYIQAGLSQGFRIGFDRESIALKSPARNHPSATANESLVSANIRAEVERSRPSQKA